MTLINLKDLSITLGEPLFTNLNLSIGKGERIGLVAANGQGKSTLLRCLAGGIEPTSGDVTRARGLRMGHVEQDVPLDLLYMSMFDVILGALPDQSESWRVDIALDDLAVPDEFRTRPLAELSGGWQRVALLARAWVTEPDLLLLDEPTNHLDLSRIGILQSWLATVARGVAILVASHDRAFLDAATNRTLFLRERQSQDYALPYTHARAALAETDAAQARQFDNDMKQVGQLRRQAAKLKNIGINSGSDLLVVKTKQLNERAERLENIARPAHQQGSAGAIRLGNSGTHAKAIVAFDNAPVTTPEGRALFQTGKLWINRGDRIVLLGTNGSGKTRMVTLVKRAISDGVERIKVTPTTILGYSDQSLSQFKNDASPFDAVASRFEAGDQNSRNMLVSAGIGIDLQQAKIAALSGGQLARLAMLVLRLTQPNFYLLDEPTNHLDIEGQEALEKELQAHGASCLLVSHDRAFVRAVGNRFWIIEGTKLIERDDPDGFFAQSLGKRV